MITATNDDTTAIRKPVPKSKRARTKIQTVMDEFNSGDLKSGGSGEQVTDPRQAVAIAISEARRAKKK